MTRLPDEPAFTSLLEEDAEDLYENAPCGYLSTRMDGQIAKINTTLLTWLGYTRDQLVGRRSFADLLTVGGRMYHETHFAPLLAMQGEIGAVALELRAPADRSGAPRPPVPRQGATWLRVSPGGRRHRLAGPQRPLSRTAGARGADPGRT